MEKIKRRSFLIIFALILILPFAFILTACGGETSKSKEITDLRIRLGENEWANSISVDYGTTIGEMFEDATFYFVYSDGEKKDVVESNFSESEWNEISNSYAEQYFVQIVNEVTGESNYEPYTGNTTSRAVLEVGQYRVDISLKNKTASIYVSVYQASLQSKQLSVVILPNENNNYGSKLNAVQTYKYGMPINHFENDEENYTSDYKIYVIDKQNNNKVLSGTDVKQVYALPEVYEGGVYSSFDDIEEGDNLLEYYNTIEVLDDSSNIDERVTFQKKQEFLLAYGWQITTGHNYSDNSLILQTERLKPGNYHLFANYESKNYQSIYTEPLTELVVEKGVFDLKKAIRYSGQEWSEENAEEIISKVKININYTFNLDSPLNTVDYYGNVVKALTATQLNQYNVSANADYNSDNAFSDVDFGYAGGGYTGLSLGKFRLVEKDANRKDIRFDCDSILDESVKFVYILDNNDYYENDPTVYTTDDFDEVSLNISKGQVSRPYASIGNNLSREYTGESQTVENAGLNIDNYDKALLEQIGIYSATEIGNYSITFKLKDSTNFCFREEDNSYNYGEDDGNGGRTFTWAITPIEFSAWDWGYDHLEGSYNEEQLEYVSSVQYISGVHTLRVSLPKDSKYDLLKSKVPTAKIVWERVETNNDAIATLTPDGDDLVITFASEGYVNLKATIAETDYSLAFENANLQVVINNASFTQEQKAAILAEIGAEEKDNDVYGLDANHTIRISRISMLLPNVLPDYTDVLNPPATADLGEWKIYYNDGNEYIEKHNGSHLDGEDTIGWMFRFIPSDDMFNGLWVYVDFINDIEFYNEDIPTEAIDALKQDVPFTFDTTTNKYIATNSITMERTGNSVMLPDNTLVVTSENGGYLEYEGIEGKWRVYADDVPFENRSNYYFDVEGQSEEWITSSERVWTIQFVPRNTGYNNVVINVNVIIPNN
ncbi:MAG: hypothetical protein IJ542_02965 [Clostridia bacterium]|nr:hypothetical protein [Clostridia bacterium]